MERTTLIFISRVQLHAHQVVEARLISGSRHGQKCIWQPEATLSGTIVSCAHRARQLVRASLIVSSLTSTSGQVVLYRSEQEWSLFLLFQPLPRVAKSIALRGPSYRNEHRT